MMAGWWFGTFFIFGYISNNHPNWIQLTNIFQRGSNHQPVNDGQWMSTDWSWFIAFIHLAPEPWTDIPVASFFLKFEAHKITNEQYDMWHNMCLSMDSDFQPEKCLDIVILKNHCLLSFAPGWKSGSGQPAARKTSESIAIAQMQHTGVAMTFWTQAQNWGVWKRPQHVMCHPGNLQCQGIHLTLTLVTVVTSTFTNPFYFFLPGEVSSEIEMRFKAFMCCAFMCSADNIQILKFTHGNPRYLANRGTLYVEGWKLRWGPKHYFQEMVLNGSFPYVCRGFLLQLSTFSSVSLCSPGV